MRKLIIIRGHSGSGKSTFAKQKIVEFKQHFPSGKVFHIENDQFLYENGEYIWTKERFQSAKMLAEQKLALAWEFAKSHPKLPVFIVISNVNLSLQAVEKYQQIATRLHLQIEKYRLMNFFKNQHYVDVYTVLSMYLALEQQPLVDEVIVRPINKMPYFMHRILEKMRKNRDKKYE
ncbi:recombinase RecA [Actinobacillus genomosp. 2]|uniref:recombinase RecA n=1 Tax=Actinobacillus genomosp. 2 TaxID=230709 RepID=UPI002442B383|nr:recombinase RecA [Actinobacillus genomosp. 2]WGE32881.1 recombinase RecA [Actinobacillus genomosp. 2]